MQNRNKIGAGLPTKSSLRCIAHALAILAFSLSIFGCTATKFLKEGESFYGGHEIHFDTQGKRVGRKKILRTELEEYIQPKPNKKFLGMRPSVWFYFIAGTPKKEKGLKSFIKNKLGKPPVYFTDATPDRTARTLSGQLKNEGYFQSEVGFTTKEKKHETIVNYNVLLPRPYRLDTIRYPRPQDSVYAPILRTLRETSLLKERQRFDLERMQAEQSRIEEELENVGFYYFDDRYLIFEADSTTGKRKVNVRLRLEKGISPKAKRIYKINDVNIYSSYELSIDSAVQSSLVQKVDGYNYIDSAGNFRPSVITRVINFKKGNIFRREDQDFTLHHLMGLGVFKFVNIKFSEVHPDSALLNTNIFLTALKKKSIRAEVQGISKSNNFVGPGLSLTFTNRNFLRGAELFEVKLNTAYEVQISSQTENKPLNAFEVGLEASLTVPRFISPIRIDYSSRKFIPKTVFKAGVNLQNRVGYFRLNSFNISAGYNWMETEAKTHELYPVDISFVQTDKESQDFLDQLEQNPVLANSFQDQFIIGTRYSYTLNTQLTEDPLEKFEEKKFRTHNFYFNGNVDVAGNLFYAIQRQFNKSSEVPLTIFNQSYAQYVKGDIDFRYYHQFDLHNKLATRLIIGAGYAYKNAEVMPYIKQFSIGGSNSIRAFPARSLGPGTYNVREDRTVDTQFIDQRGDIKLEGNVEFRFDIIKFLKGAVFVDAGNIWLLQREDVKDPNDQLEETRKGGRFHTDTFLKELAVGTGVGLRFDFNFFVLRLDTAFPLRIPSRLDDPWVADNIDMGSSTWRKENLIFNIAIGYPF
jgi:outer membrane protein insertion porin family